MNNLGSDPQIIRLAQDLGLPRRGDCLKTIRRFALDQVNDLVSHFPVTTLEDLLKLVASKLSVEVKYLRSDEEVKCIAKETEGSIPKIEKLLHIEFLESDTEGMLLRRGSPEPGDLKYLALIDARGNRRWRAYFTAWHELTHRLLTPPQMAFPGFRRTPPPTQRRKDPLEQVVDHVTGVIAFYEPLFRPALEQAIRCEGGFCLAAVERAREAVAPEASFLAAAMASIRVVSKPVCLVQVDLGLKTSEERRARSMQTFLPGMSKHPPSQKLRVKKSIPNALAKESGMRIFRNMRVPQESVLYRAFHEDIDDTEISEKEDMSLWETSKGGHLSPMPVRVFAACRGRYVYGLIIADDQ